MSNILDDPFAVVAVFFAVQLVAAHVGDFLRKKGSRVDAAEHADFVIILPATLTLLGLTIGFTFSMAVSRYDHRKNCEEAEASAISTEYVRADLLPAAEAAHVRELLAKYVEQRVRFYQVRDPDQLKRIDEETTSLQNHIWSVIIGPTTERPTPLAALVVAGMNAVLSSRGDTQAAWWNRIPVGAWVLMGVVAIVGNLLLGFSEFRAARTTLVVLPLVVTAAFFLIADIDGPRGGIIHVAPQNLIALSQMLHAH
jgi:hypothetical protein